MEVTMTADSTPDFSLAVEGVKGVCPAGEAFAKQMIIDRKIPVFSCEGPCIRGEIARLAANLVAEEVPSFARCCHAEMFVVPHSSMARWVKGADQAIMIDGCFLKCHGRILKNLIDEEKMIQIDTLPLHRKYNDIFLMDDVPEAERKAVARQVADKVIAMLKKETELRASEG
ncbi:MAG: putative zinc-binding protein [Acidiferrobacterales bacterium]